jgi:hypothetical protein
MRRLPICLILASLLCGCGASVGDVMEEGYIATERRVAGWFGDVPPPAPVVNPPETRWSRVRLGEIRERPVVTPASERRGGFGAMEAARAETRAVEAELIGRAAHTPNTAEPAPPQPRNVARPIATIAPPDRRGRLDPAQRDVIANVADTLRERPGRLRLVGPQAATSAVAAELRRNDIEAERITVDPVAPRGVVSVQIFVDL